MAPPSAHRSPEETATSRRGLTIPLNDVPPAGHRKIVEEFADLGCTGVWPAQTHGVDAFTPVSGALTGTVSGALTGTVALC